MDRPRLETELTQELAIILGQPITADDSLHESGLDSFATMQLIAYLEDTFGIEIPEERLPAENFSNVRVIAEWVNTMIGEVSEL